MRRSPAGLLAGLFAGLLATAATAPVRAQTVEFRSVGVPAAVLYDGPSVKSRKLFVAPRGMPLEVLSAVGPWTKVRDQGGDLMWIEQKDLSDRRMVVATVALATVRSAAQDSAAVAFQVERGVVLELMEPGSGVSPGWLRVRHRDGTAGWLRASEVWGD